MTHNVWLPIVGTEDLERSMFNLLCTWPGQERSSILWDECLHLAAIKRSQQAAVEWGHCFQGSCVNRIVRAMCSLPAKYPENGNSIESLVGGVRNAKRAIEALLVSSAHTDHLLGRNDFFREQNRCAIGFSAVPNSDYSFYYAVLISR